MTGSCTVADDTNNDLPCVDAALTAAKASTPAVLFFEDGTYNITTNAQLEPNASNLVLRGESQNAVIKFHSGTAPACVGTSGFYGTAFICTSNDVSFSNEVDWTDGYAAGDRVITVSSTAEYATGEWVLARLHAGADCFEGSWAQVLPGNNGLTHFARISCMDGENCDTGQLAANQVELDRPLRRDFGDDPDCVPAPPDANTPDLQKVNGVITNWGMESLHITHSSNAGATYHHPLQIKGVSRG